MVNNSTNINKTNN